MCMKKKVSALLAGVLSMVTLNSVPMCVPYANALNINNTKNNVVEYVSMITKMAAHQFLLMSCHLYSVNSLPIVLSAPCLYSLYKHTANTHITSALSPSYNGYVRPSDRQ